MVIGEMLLFQFTLKQRCVSFSNLVLQLCLYFHGEVIGVFSRTCLCLDLLGQLVVYKEIPLYVCRKQCSFFNWSLKKFGESKMSAVCCLVPDGYAGDSTDLCSVHEEAGTDWNWNPFFLYTEIFFTILAKRCKVLSCSNSDVKYRFL